ncbi:hypothetical protein ACFXN2_08130 [Streptomyces kronopolitis]|uniref:hypothetical protein n=1 Tax=Streptomyces kronopolitis TaxID=1612435 RepID=UPI0036744D01
MTKRRTRFTETMTGTVTLTGEREARPVRLDLEVRTDTVLLPWRTTRAQARGRLRVDGWEGATPVAGEMEISPLARRRIRYRLTFRRDGRTYLLDGWKSPSPRRPLASMTVLPFTVHDEERREAGRGTVRFSLSGALLPFLASFRFPAEDPGPAQLAPRWNGRPGRTEVWYTTLTDPSTGTGVWLHHEITAPEDGSRAYAHGWVAVCPPGGPVDHARFGPEPVTPDAAGFRAADALAGPGRLRGSCGPYTWDLTEHQEGATLHTFPAWAWRRPLLPAAQIVPGGRARYTGTVRGPGTDLALSDAPGATGRIYGHGNARRWAWLHADLGGGDVLEVVAAVARRPGLDRLPPLVFLRLRRAGRDWPRRGTRTALGWGGLGRFRAEVGLPSWTVTGRAGPRRIRVTVDQPEERTLALEYTDPDGSRAVCRNSVTADARIVLERWWGGWRPEAAWTLRGTAHAEVGER